MLLVELFPGYNLVQERAGISLEEGVLVLPALLDALKSCERDGDDGKNNTATTRVVGPHQGTFDKTVSLQNFDVWK